MNRKPLDKLISAAKKADRPPVTELEAPYGFATRVAATWGQSHPDKIVLLERLAWRGLICAVLVCAATAVAQKTIASSEPRALEPKSSPVFTPTVEDNLEIF